MEELCEEAFQKGYEQGYKKGYEQWIKLGIDKARMEGIMKSYHYTALQAMDALGIPTEEQPKYLSMLQEDIPHADSKI